MEELLEIRQLLEHGEIEDALCLAIELEEIGRKGITRTIRSYCAVSKAFWILNPELPPRQSLTSAPH